MSKNNGLPLNTPCNTNSDLTKLTMLENLEEIEYERQWRKEGKNKGREKASNSNPRKYDRKH